jgi:hypothetical protein
MSFLNWLEETAFSQWVVTSGYAWILTLHTIGMTIVAGIAFVLALRLLGLSPGTPVKPLDRLFPIIWWGFGLNALTGTMLLIADASTKLTNPDFYVKMVFVAIGITVLVRMRRTVFRDPKLDEGGLPRSAKGLAWVSLAAWVAAITAGRLLAYLGPVSGAKGLVNR